jgi:glycosyltransferase involved in cell wall biosynthesis
MSNATVSRTVLHVTEPVDGGVARCVLDLVADQTRRGWRVGVVSPADASFTAALEAAGAEHLGWGIPARTIVARNRPPLGSVARHSRSLGRTIFAWQPDIVHLHSSLAGIGGRLAVRGRLPTVFQPHAWSFLALTGAMRRGAVLWERMAARWATAILCVSEAERSLGEAAAIRALWRVAPNGVDVRVLAEADSLARAAARAALALDGGPFVVCVGALRRPKGQDVLLDAWPRVRARVPAAQLLLVGDGPDGHVLEQRAEEGVVFAGGRRDVARWLAAADVVVLPSRWEGMSLVLLEAMATGRSVVATDVPGAREALGEAGAIVPVEAVAPLAEALAERLLDPDLAAGEGRAGRSRAERYFDIRRTTALVADVYDAVSAARRRAV